MKRTIAILIFGIALSSCGHGKITSYECVNDGYLARDLERSCIQTLVKRGAKFANKLDVKQFDGWTESWSTKSSAPENFSELLEWVYSDEVVATTDSMNVQTSKNVFRP